MSGPLEIVLRSVRTLTESERVAAKELLESRFPSPGNKEVLNAVGIRASRPHVRSACRSLPAPPPQASCRPGVHCWPGPPGRSAAAWASGYFHAFPR